MADLIDRDTAVKQIAEAQDKVSTGIEDVTYYRAIKIIRDAPTVNRWIPCSERLPENNQRVIFTGYDPDLYICCDDGSNNYILVGWYKAEQGRGKSLGYKSLRKGFYAENPKGTSTRMHEDFVTHWMPLPEPPESEVKEYGSDAVSVLRE